MATGDTGHVTARGIEVLIDQLREKGVNAGREASSRLVADAQNRAEWIVEQAESEAAQIRQRAEEDAEFLRKTGRESLEMAYRDIRMKLRDQLSQQFARQLGKLIVQNLSDPDTLKQLLVSAASRSRLPDEPAGILLPERAEDLQQLREDPSRLQGGPLVEMVSEVARQLFTHGVEIGTSPRIRSGMQISLRDGEVRVELTEHALTGLLLEHLQPRFRALLEGVVG